MVRLRFTTEEEGSDLVHLDGAGTLVDVVMLSLERGVAWPELNTAWGYVWFVEKGKPTDVFPVYTALDADVSTVDVLVPAFGVALGVPVVDESEAGFSVAEAFSDAELDRETKGPVPIEFFAAAADGSLDVSNTAVSVTVTLSSDVTFATDSADLSSSADAVLGAATAEIGKYPSGGTLAIVGHTDDVADDAYNQDLSERRAESVSARLAELADLSAWQEP